MSVRHTTLGLAVAALVAAGAGQASAQSGTANYSSHDAEFFSNLLADRVWLYERPNSADAGDRGLVWGVHHAADGTALACIHLGGAWQIRRGRWRVVPSPRFRALYNYQEAGTEPDPGHERGHVPVFYDPGSGRLHSESVRAAGPPGGRLSRWFVLSLGWVQESWPRALKDVCPALGLPAGLPVNEKQTATVMEEAVAQDPAAALRAAPGYSPIADSHLRAPGSTGLAMAAGAPTVSAARLQAFLMANDGHVLESPAGTRLVLVLGAERDELWRLDAGGEVTDTAHLLAAADGAGIVAQWDRLPRRLEYRLGDPFPLRPTGERHHAFLLSDRLVADGRPLTLPFGAHGAVPVRLHAGGAATAEGTDKGEIGGRWWWSRGRLHVALEGTAETSAYPWRALAARVAGRLGAEPAGPDAAGEAD